MPDLAPFPSTRDYDDESLAEELVSCLPKLPVAMLLRIAQQAQAIAYRKHAAAGGS